MMLTQAGTTDNAYLLLADEGWILSIRLFAAADRNTYNRIVLVSEFDYSLPAELIAQEPLLDRSASRLLRLVRDAQKLGDHMFREFPSLLRPDDLVVFNNTRVFPARLLGRRSGARAQAVSAHNPAARDFLTGKVEVLLTRQLSEEPNEWECLVRPGRKIGVGEQIFFGESGAAEKAELQAEVIARSGFGERQIRFNPAGNFFETVEQLGHVPLPPYIDRADDPTDRERYQTVYASQRGSVAAPTAGLHFTPEILNELRTRGIEIAEITLHVGLGTFQPVREARVEDNHVHKERFTIPAEAAQKINRALENSRRVVAVGTTTVRTLEHSAAQAANRKVAAGSGEADIFIYPGHKFRVVGALLTNFHLPQSTLLMLVAAFGGKDKVMAAYQRAVQDKYRFYSYGDCMLIE
ncbi:MAG TPA: tRNA preQ1(34) S-adenosylmethionine ribosyltransferase-isomerase QueA [Terriglobales bacterium]